MVHVAVLGAAGGIGQPVSLLLKQNPAIKKLSLYDIVNTPGVAADLSHIDTPAEVKGYLPPDDGLKKALTGVDIVVIPAGVPRKPGMTRDDLFKINAGIVRDLATGIATTAPDAFVLVISNPVNSTVPIVSEVFKKHNVYDPKRIFGVTTLDVVRASTFLAEATGDVTRAPRISVPVLGGHSGATIIPIISQAIGSPQTSIPEEEVKALINRIQYGGDEVVKAKDGAGSATLSMAYAAAKFTNEFISSWTDGKDHYVHTYVAFEADEENGYRVRKEIGAQNLEYFAVNIKIGPDGVEKILPVGDMTDYERELMQKALPELQDNIAKGVSFINAPKL